MVGDRFINAKELLSQHNKIVSKKIQETKNIRRSMNIVCGFLTDRYFL